MNRGQQSREAEEFHEAWAARDVPALMDLVMRTSIGWTIIGFALAVVALIAVIAGQLLRPAENAGARPAEPALQRDGCIACAPEPATPVASWVTTEDYPASAMRSGEEGVSALSLTIGTNGRVTACTVTQQSGSDALDRAGCRALTARARYYPATDTSGQPIEATVSRRIRWQLPPEG